MAAQGSSSPSQAGRPAALRCWDAPAQVGWRSVATLTVRGWTLFSFPRHGNWQGLRKNHWQEVHFLFLLPSPAVKLKAFYLNHVLDLLGIGEQFLQSFSQSEFSPSDLRVRIVHLNWKKAVLIDASHNLSHTQKASDFCIFFRFSPLPLPNLRFLSESLSF